MDLLLPRNILLYAEVMNMDCIPDGIALQLFNLFCKLQIESTGALTYDSKGNEIFNACVFSTAIL